METKVSVMILQIIVIFQIVMLVEGRKNHLLYWNTTNAEFKAGHIEKIVSIDVNQGNLPWEYDQVNIICPFNSQEKHVIYSVSKEEFDSCRVSNPRPKIVAMCDKPQSFKYFTITFRSFSPSPGGLEFKPGQNYYFVSTSNSKDIHRRVGGYCQNNNMKMVFKVADNRHDETEYKKHQVIVPPTPQHKTVTSQPSLYSVSKAFLKTRNFEEAHENTSKPSISPSSSIWAGEGKGYYDYKTRTPSVRTSDYLYYYSPRDLIQLKIAAKKYKNLQTKDNETYRSGKLISSSSLNQIQNIVLVFCFSLKLFLR